MSLSVASYASARGISAQRVRELARAEKIRAHRDGRVWIIDEPADSLRPTSRPLSAQSLSDLLSVTADMNLDSVTGVRKQRAAERLRRLRASKHPAALLAQWAGNKSARPENAHHRALMEAARQGLDDYFGYVLRENEAEDFSDPIVLRKRLRDAMQVNKLDPEALAQRSHSSVDDVRALLSVGRLRNFGRTARILEASGLRPGKVPR